MKKRLIEHLENMTDPIIREKALANMETKYADEMVYTLGMALMLGVNKNSEEDRQFWKRYNEDNSQVSRYAHFYSYQPKQQEEKK